MADSSLTLAEVVADRIRARLTFGVLTPGQRLSEAALARDLGVSRNTLREAFRLLTKDGLLEHKTNRGVFVATPSMGAIIDIYHIRRIVECQALRMAHGRHPAVARMAEAVAAAQAAQGHQDWRAVGNANMDFHAAIVELADSPKLTAFYGNLAAELRLAFGLLKLPRNLHEPYIGMNADLLATVQDGQYETAARQLDRYLSQSERAVLAALSGQGGGG
ncbi:GntR family transcriptional regulator [Paracoccus sp. Z330]|uniref:GntR family transcriptional regulator n=1 Tax=Paracoccus onchidii TaxID=3017813 RepID=A0ABT4ZIX5_9RHOB|nr:GntR family transcriptional regulator [Paracoccus onchidii]MDB6178696.1 GntR family transcriptional regulator [Paracoccus onchidii]